MSEMYDLYKESLKGHKKTSLEAYDKQIKRYLFYWFIGCIINSVGEISHHTIFIYKKDMDLW